MAETTAPAPAAEGANEAIVNPNEVKGNVDYNRLIDKFGTTRITEALLERFERVTGHKPHPLMRRGLFFSHREFDRILTTYEKGEPFFLYTGRGPSSGSMHIGHAIPFSFTKYLQDVFDVPLVIMLTEDEKYLWQKAPVTVDEARQFAYDNAKDIIAFGFDPKKTFIYNDFDFIGGAFYQNIVEFSRLLTPAQVRGAMGFSDESHNIGQVFYPAIQCAAGFASSYPESFGEPTGPGVPRSARLASMPVLIPCAIDQDPYFRLVRDNSHRMHVPIPKAALIHSKFITALQGPLGKMSASNPNSAIYLSDTPKQIKDKVNKHAFSGGRDTLEEHRALGGNPDIDVAYQYLSYFLDDDAELARIGTAYRKGEMLTGELKKACIAQLQEYVGAFQQRRAAVTDDIRRLYMTPRKLEFKGNQHPNPHPLDDVTGTPPPGIAVDPVSPPEPKVEKSDPIASAGAATRPPLGRKTTYGIRGLSSYGGQVSEMLYPARSHEERESR